MESNTTNQMNTNKEHACPPGGHCCDCSGCGSMCTRGGGMHGMKKYWLRHLIILAVGVILAFFVGMKLGEIKGYMMASYQGMPYHKGWVMKDRQMNPEMMPAPTTPPPTAQ